MTILETMGLGWLIFSSLIGNALLLYLAWLGAKCVQKEREGK